MVRLSYSEEIILILKIMKLVKKKIKEVQNLSKSKKYFLKNKKSAFLKFCHFFF